MNKKFLKKKKVGNIKIVLSVIAVVAILAILVFTSFKTNQLGTSQDVRSHANESTAPLLSLDFENGWTAAGGQTPAWVNGAAWVKISNKTLGKSAYLYDKSALAYPALGNLDKDKGTLEFWFKPLNWDNDYTSPLFKEHRFFDVRFKCNTPGCANYMIFGINNTSQATKTITFSIYDYPDKWPDGPTKDAVGHVTIIPPYIQWYHIAVTWNKDTGSKVYANGILIAQYNGSYSLNDITDIDPTKGFGVITIAQNPGLGKNFNQSAKAVIDNYTVYGYEKDASTIKGDYLIGNRVNNVQITP